MQWNEIPETSPNLPILRRLAERQEMLWVESEVPCATVRLPRTWEEYLSALRPRFRTKVRSALRNLEGRSEVQFGFCDTAADLDRLLPVLFDLHTRRWAQDGKPGVFGWDRKRDFYYALSSPLLERGWLRFSWLEWQGRVLACQYGFVYGGSYSQLQEGYEPASEHWNVGVGLRAWSIRELIKAGVSEYDFLGGVGRHKTDWGAEVKRSKKILAGRTTYQNLLFCRGPEWEERVRGSVKQVLPGKLLAARQRYLEERRVASIGSQNGSAAESAAGRWARRAMAGCYVHLGLPALARRLRDQYQLSISHGGKWPRISWSRRADTAGRILYYHRVNNECDPFFPAMSTELFEQEMRFVARHYRVVSLGELRDRLENGTPEVVLAITFDDGYQDNYTNALPILQRYGLPATVFLTTGGVDSREPLWFEHMAEALKKTRRESIDLEIDIPRRFWLRSQAERLEANGRIFSLLRGVPDVERRRWLGQILRHLDVPSDGRKDRMLTWDQARRMKACGIDFGGHTVTHPFLSKVTRDDLAHEVSECKRRIEEELQLPVRHFAYPNGREEDFGEWNKELIRAAGYSAALTTIWGMNYRSTDPMELRRGQPWEENPALFACKLDWYQLMND